MIYTNDQFEAMRERLACMGSIPSISTISDTDLSVLSMVRSEAVEEVDGAGPDDYLPSNGRLIARLDLVNIQK